jgi:heme-degrading monooxygenase HmoA
VAIRVIVEFQAKPGARAELASVLENIMATLAPTIPGFLGSTLFQVLDSPDALIEIAEWDSADAQAAAVGQAMESGVYGHVFELVAAPLKATRISQLDERV